MKNLTLTLIKEYPFIFKNCDDYPVFDDPGLYIYHFQKLLGQKFVLFNFTEIFKLEILNGLNDKIYNSFHTYNASAQVFSLVTYIQFDRENHASGIYMNNQKTNKHGISFTFFCKDHSFATSFIKEHEHLLVDQEENNLGFGGLMR